MVIGNRAASPASTADEYPKPVLLTQIMDAFRTYAWAAMGELVQCDLCNQVKCTCCKKALKVSHLVIVESSGVVMSFASL